MMTEKDTMQVKPEKKEDRRVRRTKKLLTHGLIQLMKEKQVQDITVRELADLVDVNRGTFYLYYRDIFDMLDSIEQELFNQVNQLIAAHKGETVLTHTLPVLKELFHLVEENKELCQVLLGQNGDMKFLKKLSDVVQEAFRREWLMMKKDEVTFDYSYAFGALGFVGLLRTWLERHGSPQRPHDSLGADQQPANAIIVVETPQKAPQPLAFAAQVSYNEEDARNTSIFAAFGKMAKELLPL